MSRSLKLVAVLCLALAVTACGKRGPLEPPSGSDGGTDVTAKNSDKKNKKKQEPGPHRDNPLDGLLR